MKKPAERKLTLREKLRSLQLDWRNAGRWVLALLLLLSTGAGAFWTVEKLQDPRVLPFKVVRIDGGLRHLDRLQIEKAVGGEIRGNFFTVDVERIYRAACNLPWVDQASVRRLWPDTLLIKISEQTPLARWGERQLVNPEGEIFSPLPHEIPEGLPQLSGPDGSSREVVLNFLNMKPRLTLLGLELEKVNLDARRSWMLVFTGGMRLHLGNRELEGRLQRFLAVFPRIRPAVEEDQSVLDVDLRYTNGFTVRWQRQRNVPDSDDRSALIGMRSANTGGPV